MLSKNKLKYIQSLRLKKYRQRNNAFIVEGVKMVDELLQVGKLEIECICAIPSWIETYKPQSVLVKETLIPVNEKELKQLSNLKTPNQVLAVVKQADSIINFSSIEKSYNLYLDNIQDPGNLGTILRIADWFGIPNVICSPTCVEVYNPKVIQSSMGAFHRVHCMNEELEKITTSLPNLSILGAVLDATSIYTTNFPKAGLLVIGNESQGISINIKKLITHQISIPRYAKGGAESLNAAVATGIICAHIKSL